MNIFSKILGKIFPSSHPAVKETQTAQAGSPAAPPQGPVAPGNPPAAGAGTAPPTGVPAGVEPGGAATAASTRGAQPTAPAGSAQPAQPARPAAPPVDVGAVLAGLAAKNPQKLNYQTSIVDLMKLLDLDSSLAARKELARELGYKGDMSDSAAMNIWLHKQVIAKLEENGGQVPQELRS